MIDGRNLAQRCDHVSVSTVFALKCGNHRRCMSARHDGVAPKDLDRSCNFLVFSPVVAGAHHAAGYGVYHLGRA